MNSSSNETILVASDLFSLIGKLSVIQLMHIYFLVPLSLIAVGFNIIIFMTLTNKEFEAKKFFAYFRLNVINSIILSLIIATSFIGLTKNVFEFTNSYAANFYFCFIYTPLLSTFYLNNSLLEIFIVVERCLYFMPSRCNKLKLINYKILGVVTFLLSFLVSLPLLFLTYPKYKDFEIEINSTFRLYFWEMSNLSMSSVGKMITYLMYFLRDILPLILKLCLNLISVIFIRNYKKRLQQEKLAFALKLTNPSIVQTENIRKTKFTNQERYISKRDRNQTYMAIILSVLSLFKHLFYLTAYILISLEEFDLFSIFFSLLTLKHISNFFILYKFSYLFRTEFKKCCLH